MKYVAFLRGINVGGNVLVSMAKLKEIFEASKFTNVQTLLASGNVRFEFKKAAPETLVTKIEQALESAFGRHLDVIVRPIGDLEKLKTKDPFKKVKVIPTTRLYVTFLADQLQGDEGIVCTAIQLQPNRGTVDFMTELERKYGKKITTRNWNTILKIITKAEG